MRKIFFLLVLLFPFLTSYGQTPASWRFEQKNNEDGTIDLIFHAEIEQPWYVYNTGFIKNGPLPTSFEIKESDNFTAIDGLKDFAEPKSKLDKAFKIDVLVFEKEASFIQKIKRISNEKFKVEGMLSYQVCNGKECVMEELDVVFDVAAGNTAGSNEGSVTKIPENGATVNGAPANESNEDKDGLFLFLLVAFLAGLGGVITPCVFPMIPMTVSFFISGSGSKRNGIFKGLIFGLSVTLIYALIGVIVALFRSTDATDVLGTHWIPNLIFAVLFIVFAISFLGAFEITLPGGLANKADAKADKGGFIASFFVALAMVIVSFSCTGPFVGSILAASVTGGLALKPILGMVSFGVAFSLPFVIFSFFPALMKKMPKSGGWLNVVKVVFAFIMLAFSLKFLASADAYFGLGIINRAVFISAWIAIAIMLGIYLLGGFRTSHDSEVKHTAPGRVITAIISFAFAIYLIPGLFGAPLPELSALIPPQDGSTIVLSGVSPSPENKEIESTDISKGLCGVSKYANPKNRAPYDLNSYYDIDEAIACAKELNKPVLLSFKAVTCSACKLMEATVWSDPAVLDILRNKIVLTSLYVDDRTELPLNEQITSKLDGKLKNTLGRKLRDYQLTRYGVASQPYYVLVDHNGELLTKPVGECSTEEFLNFLNSGIANFIQ
ncbi:MAG: protein-disulfide reductase DsbD family protein [Bacteroidales bacterium]